MGRMKDLVIVQQDMDEGRYDQDIDYDYMYWVDSILGNKQYFKEFETAMNGLDQLSGQVFPDENLQQILWRQVYIGAIGSMEVFLADAFNNITLAKPKYLKKFVETNPEFKNRRFDMREIYEVYDKISETAKKIMYDTIYHDLGKVKQMYTTTFNMKFPDIGAVSKAVHKRHDLVHRNGKTKTGKKIILSAEELSETLGIVKLLVSGIQNELRAANVDFYDAKVDQLN
ncbi:hypothetical protein [Pedobacter gandavensis]|uniref:hypothetical protein n=1 Tax=Pedobacter gandavensis TaxID=2679963 RepID=UPI00292D443C|nr:hypothetical protein [Pedobacter gandavensis]